MSDREYCDACGVRMYPRPRGWCCVSCLVKALDKDQARTYDPRTHRAISVEALENMVLMVEFSVGDPPPSSQMGKDLAAARRALAREEADRE